MSKCKREKKKGGRKESFVTEVKSNLTNENPYPANNRDSAFQK